MNPDVDVFELIFDLTSDLMGIADRDGYFKRLNPAWTQTLGWTTEELLAEPLASFIHPDDVEATSIELDRQLASGIVADFVNRYRCKDGSHRLLEWVVIPAREGGFVACARDITERITTEQDIAFERDLLNTLLDSTPDYIYFKDRDLKFVRASKSFCDLLCCRLEDVIGKTDEDLFPPQISALTNHDERQIIETKVPLINKEEGGEVTAGKKTFVLTTKLPWYDKQNTVIGLFGISRDITEKKFLEHQLLQSQKLEAIGQLTGGIAHDFNNLLQIIQTNLELLNRKIDGEQDSRDLIESTLKAGQGGAALINQLLAFSRRQPLMPKEVSVNRLLEGMLNLLERTLGRTIEIETALGSDLPLVRVDQNALENAILNLAINARNATPLGGVLTLRTAERYLDERGAAEHDNLKPGRYVEICLIDSGSGMEPDVMDRAFEPFFTTAEVGEGSGLGLSMVYGFSKQSGGQAWLQSEPGKGTTVTILLPALGETAVCHEEQPLAATEPVMGGGLILLVEDDAAVRESGMRLLRSLGYDAIEAENARQALQILKDTPEIDLLFTDIVMPGGMSGVDLAREALRRNKHLKVAFASGYPEPQWETSEFPEAGFTFLSKPYLFDDLTEALTSLLAK